MNSGGFEGYAFGPLNEVKVSILQFTDNTLFLGKASVQNMLVIKSALRCFELASGLKINFHKSKLVGIGLEERITNRYASLLNCKVMKAPFTYLGLPVGGNSRRMEFWDPVVNKLKGRLSRWRQRTISFGGKITLIASVLSSIPL